jgi:hypothetical protein
MDVRAGTCCRAGTTGGTDTAAATVRTDEKVATGSVGLRCAAAGGVECKPLLSSLPAAKDLTEGGNDSVGRVRRKRDPVRGAALLRCAASFESGELSCRFELAATVALSTAWLSTCPDCDIFERMDIWMKQTLMGSYIESDKKKTVDNVLGGVPFAWQPGAWN